MKIRVVGQPQAITIYVRGRCAPLRVSMEITEDHVNLVYVEVYGVYIYIYIYIYIYTYIYIYLFIYLFYF